MSAIQNSLPSLPTPWVPLSAQTQPTNDSGRVIFTRQLWQRTMPDGPQSDQGVLNKSRTEGAHRPDNSAAGPSRRTSSTVSTRSQRRSPSPSRGSKTPLTPEESPPFRTTRKRNAGAVEDEDKELDSASTTPAHTRASSGDSTAHVCICQPDPKIPRPRNAFILYRQHHQANVIAQHPGLANPEISKIIGEQWQNQSAEVKGKWKALAEEEKLRHQQQYPTYRYQPKRNGRRNSLSSEAPGSAGEKPKCAKCGGRSILAPSTPFSSTLSNGASPASVPPTPGSAITPISRTLPILRDLSLQSPAVRRMGRVFPGNNMSPGHNGYVDDRDDIGPLSPDNKRRRFNGDHGPPVSRAMPPRYGTIPPNGPFGPGTPFPFGQGPPPHPYPPAMGHARRESLPGLRGMVSPAGPMAPPPRPGMGYQQHRMSQGHIPHDRSLTLPPLQTGSISGPSGAAATAGSGKTVEEQIMNMPFRYKVRVLGQVAPPALNSRAAPRGPLIAIEGDNADAVAELGKWLYEELRRGSDLAVGLIDSPDVSSNSGKKPIVQYHLLATDWLSESDNVLASIKYKAAAEPVDAAMSDVSPTKEPAQSVRKLDEDYDDSDSSTKGEAETQKGVGKVDEQPQPADSEKMEVDKTPTTAKPTSSASFVNSAKPVGIIANYSLHASNVFACRIPIGPLDQYSPSDHWQWTATQWRGVIGPDLTIFVRDAVVGETGKATVEMMEEGNLFVVKRTRSEADKGLELEPSALRRLGFEVSEWVRAFGSEKRGSV
ncbi:hypothetical protein LTR36_010770 [Oleoguttula mirabilis]|uniref:HMG box domain-containing protein n=1 Tax=Oleoguttula mirabilis TaxID=1507867 RepID=A0AAV9JRJ9_9PEZI|nr:hypothetical protein LTR36_010770 [Oleoguttula mirabilis]